MLVIFSEEEMFRIFLLFLNSKHESLTSINVFLIHKNTYLSPVEAKWKMQKKSFQVY